MVLEHLKTYGSITPLEAQELYGIMRLGARIWDLRHDSGVKIKKETKRSKNRYGASVHFASYRLEEQKCLLALPTKKFGTCMKLTD
jgi:hypothetical protein